MHSKIPILCQVQALYSFKSNDPSSLSFNKDDLIDVLSKLPSGWWDGLCNGSRGWFPSNYVKLLINDTTDKSNEEETTTKQSNEYRLSLAYSNTLSTATQQRNSNWIVQRTEDGSDVYYFNPSTGEMMFENKEIDQSIPTANSDLCTKQLPSLISLVVEQESDTLSTMTDQQSEYKSAIWSNQSSITISSVEDDINPHVRNVNTSKQQLSLDNAQNNISSHTSIYYQASTSTPKLPPRRLSSACHKYLYDQPLTWPNVLNYIAVALHQLTTAAKNCQYHLYAYNAAEVVNAIRFMLISSSTLDKDSPNIKSNVILRSHHRALMAAMSKLVLSAQNSHNVISTNEKHQHLVDRILVESSELLLAVRNFISVCQMRKVPLVSTEPQWISSSNGTQKERRERHSSNASINNQRYSLQLNFAESIETMGACIQDTADTIIKGISSHLVHQQTPDIAFISTLLFTHFQNLSNQTSLFLGYLDEADFSQVEQHQNDMIDLKQGKQRLMDCLGLLLFHMQALTSPNATKGILIRLKDTEKATGDLFDPIKSICESVLRLASKNNFSRGTDSRASFTSNSMTEPTTAIKKDDSTIVEEEEDRWKSHQSSLLLETMERHKSESVLCSSSTTEKLAPKPFPMQRSQTAPIKQTMSSSKLKRFFGDDAPIPEVTTKDETNDVIPNTTSTASTNKVDERPAYLNYDYGPNDIVFNMEGQVKGGTLPALVERLTSHDYLDMNFINTFLLTYRSFCSSVELLDLLESRYNLFCPDNLTLEEASIWEEKKLKLVRLRVFNVLKNWLEHYYYDDAGQLLDRLLEFTQKHIRTTLKFSNGQLESLIEQRRHERSGRLKKMILTLPDPPEPILPKIGNRRRFILLDIDVLEMARQLTIMDFKLYSAIRPIECLDKVWSQEDDTTAVNIRASIEYCNQVTSWVSDVILSQHDIKKRSVLIKYWVQVAEKCRVLNNFNTCMAILSAFDNSSVGRLKRTWEVVGARTSATLQQIRKLMGANRNFVEYRAIIHSVNPPCIPFLGIYLQDLTFIEDGNANELKSKAAQQIVLINFAKRAKTAEVIREIQQYQLSLYQLKPVDDLQEFIKTNLISTRDEEQLYKESLKLEPREREDEKITRLLQESGFL
ncbi:MAG: ras guanine nucleotide exchange factor domain-containing protein [Benjaminiella poitrasii]|nr:MAG: ras guanine nucleotide exchange factor domain-containing protein [Benjaminiella poitrasii]